MALTKINSIIFTLLFLPVLLVATSPCAVQAFVSSSSSTPCLHHQRTRTNTQQNMLIMDAALDIADSSSTSYTLLIDPILLLAGGPSSAATMLQKSAGQVFAEAARQVFKPDVEAEFLTDVSHIIMDFSGFFTLSKSLLKVYSVVGRILVLLADYLPDHTIHSEELLVQLFLLSVGVNDMVKTVHCKRQ
jgi:hypothetical protein